MKRTAMDYEAKWRKVWEEARVYEANYDPSKPKFFITFPYSYQNGPLHVGHGFTATRADVIARFYRMRGYNVLFPWAWHWTGEAVAGLSERLKKGDEAVIRMLKEVDGVDESIISKFEDPSFICQYYTKENREVVKAMGFSVDWRREFYTTDLHPYYSRFIEWQYLTLNRLGKVKRGSHPVVWCPSCQSPTGDHDRLEGEGVSPTEFILVLFKSGDLYLAAATLRPETIFGATNVWINPRAAYVRVRVGGKDLLVSREAAMKLREQLLDVEIGEEVDVESLIGNLCEAPLTGEALPILPAAFVDPKVGTGVVYSVPSHAPYDYAALRDLQKEKESDRYAHRVRELLANLRPKSIINTPGWPEHPAVERVEEMGIENQLDPRLEELTKEIYTKEFYEGRMKESCGEFGGKKVSEARELVKAKLLESGLGLVIYDLTERVVCRSGDECIVKVVHDQWFLNYSDADWKEAARSLVRRMNVYPESARQWFLNVIDWLKDWPCARKTGLGTKLPFDPNWIVETLSDSTIYPALYTIAHHLNQGRVDPARLTPKFFDYVFRGIGDVKEVASEVGADPGVLEEMRREFEYWYPLDLRVSAKELVPNHLTFFIFHHVAMFEESMWPKGVSVNGMVQVEGAKMSKSKGNFIPLKSAIARFGADATRLTLLMAAEDMDDPDWRSKNAEEMRSFLSNFLRYVSEFRSATRDTSWKSIDSWLLTRLATNLKEIEEFLSNAKTRSATLVATYTMMNDWKWYLRRRTTLGPAAERFIECWVKVTSVFAPFTAEEAWSILQKEGLVVQQSWPRLDDLEVDEAALLAEEIISRLLDDVKNVVELAGKRALVISIYPSPTSYTALVERILDEGVFGVARNPSDTVRFAINHVGIDKGRAHKVVQRLVEVLKELVHRYSKQTILKVAEEESDVYASAKEFLSKELGAEIDVVTDSQKRDPMGKASQAIPFRPGIYIEWGENSTQGR